jgi:hypothetical protein
MRAAVMIPDATVQHEMANYCPGGWNLILVKEGKKAPDLLSLR